ncbi:hypothetical protein L1887_40595 [Cichorium endivia]|nr:hypothetical protein L1887_40595 [Cichorium endivia]
MGGRMQRKQVVKKDAISHLHPNPGELIPVVRTALKRDYSEHLLDGLFVLHNPFAKHPIPRGLLSHPRLCEVTVADDGELIMDAPDDFLLLRMLQSFIRPKKRSHPFRALMRTFKLNALLPCLLGYTRFSYPH